MESGAKIWLNNGMKYATVAISILLALFMSGCLSPLDKTGRLRHKAVEVELSSLDWIEVAYFPVAENPVIKGPCRLSLFGVGEVIVKTGRSPQLWDSFSTKVTDPYWNELFTDRMHLPPDEMQTVFQAFVDEGLIPARTFTRRTKNLKPPYVNISAQVGMEKIRTATDNPFLVGLVEESLENFGPVIRQAADALKENPSK